MRHFCWQKHSEFGASPKLEIAPPDRGVINPLPSGEVAARSADGEGPSKFSAIPLHHAVHGPPPPVGEDISPQQPFMHHFAALCEADGGGDFVVIGQDRLSSFFVPKGGEEIIEVAREQSR